MKIVIDIDENTYKHLFDNGAEVVAQTGEILLAVKNGVVLPKGHGDLKDVSEIIADLRSPRFYIQGGMTEWLCRMISQYKTIIEADKEVQNEITD